MLTRREFIKESDKVSSNCKEKLGDPHLYELEKIIESYKSFEKNYVTTRNVSEKVAKYLRAQKAIIIDTLYFENDEEAIRKFVKEYGLKEINNS